MKNNFNFYEICISILGLVLYSHSAIAGDTRNVTEPVIPSSCETLFAGNIDVTDEIQQALNICAKTGEVVRLTPSDKKSHFYSGPLTIPSGGGIRIDKGAILSALPNPTLFDNGKGTCGTLDSSGKGCKPFIYVKNTDNSGIYGEGTIDGQGGMQMTGKSITWWQLAAEAKEKSKSQNAPRLIQVDDSNNFTLYKITMKNSPNFHVSTNKVNGFTAWGITIKTPADARNTDGIDPGSSENVTITHSNISTGDDNVAIKAGNSGGSKHISILNNNFGKGHGMSIGSETVGGVSDVLVQNLSMNGTTNGLRIKSDRSRGGLVNNITYSDICIKNVKNPIYLDTHYDKNASGNEIPEFKDIKFNNINVLTTGTFTFNGFSDEQPIRATLSNVRIKKGSKWVQEHAIIEGVATEDASGTDCPSYIAY